MLDHVATSKYGERVGDVRQSTLLPADVLRGVPADLRHAENTPRQTAQRVGSHSAVVRAHPGLCYIAT